MIRESVLFHDFPLYYPLYIEYSSVLTLISPSATVLSVFFISSLDSFLLTKNLVFPLLSVNAYTGGLSPSYVYPLLQDVEHLLDRKCSNIVFVRSLRYSWQFRQ